MGISGHNLNAIRWMDPYGQGLEEGGGAMKFLAHTWQR
jgi:hypothetical protein